MPDIPDSYRKYVAWNNLPHLWCPGCGHGITLKSIALALADLEIPPHRSVLTTGIGCSGRAGDYVSFHRFQGTHGRTIAFATGINAADPDLTIIAFLGDGDCYAIGGNHLIHAARRNLNMTVIVGNNMNYGMTGGQFSPVTPLKCVTSTSRSGKTELAVDMCSLTANAGAAFAARTTVYHTNELRSFIKEAISTKGFSFIEVLSPCPTYFGRYNKLGDAVEMLQWLRENTVPLSKADEADGQLWRGKLPTKYRDDFLTAYRKQTGMQEGGGDCLVKD